ncbi:MAG: multiheme c-type cytochrome [Planctomycetota bacterium]|jgi:hypothetical protein
MKHAALSTLLLAAVLVVFGCLVYLGGDAAHVVAAPPLSLEGYLDEKLPEATEVDADIKVDNSSCYVCHGNYDGEELVLQHAKEEVGCIDCHGKSTEHCDDEDNVTPPDKMYGPETIDKMCGECHEEHDVAAVKVILRWQERCPAKTDPKKIVCTDCHGKHRMNFRTVWWDKKTRKLIIRKKGERIKVAPDLTKKKPEPPPDEPAPDSEMH